MDQLIKTAMQIIHLNMGAQLTKIILVDCEYYYFYFFGLKMTNIFDITYTFRLNGVFF